MREAGYDKAETPIEGDRSHVGLHNEQPDAGSAGLVSRRSQGRDHEGLSNPLPTESRGDVDADDVRREVLRDFHFHKATCLADELAGLYGDEGA